MRIAVAAFSAPPQSAGGVAAAQFNLFLALRRSGFEAKFFTFGDPSPEDDEHITRRGTPLFITRLLSKINSLVFGILQPGRSAYQLADIIKSAVGAGRMGREIWKYAPDILILSDHGAPGLYFQMPAQTKVILVSHHNPARFAARPDLTNASALDVRLALLLERRALKIVDAVVCPSHYMKSWFTQTFEFSGPVVVIPNILDALSIEAIETNDLKGLMGLEANEVVIYMPSAGSKMKGGVYLSEIIRKICLAKPGKVGFYIPGNVQASTLLALEDAPANALINLPGQISYEENIANLKACSFCVSPSLMENYSMALVEACFCGVPVLAFDTGGNSDIVHDGENGFLVNEGAVEELVARAVQMLEPDELGRLRNSTSHFAKTKLGLEMSVSKYVSLIEDL